MRQAIKQTKTLIYTIVSVSILIAAFLLIPSSGGHVAAQSTSGDGGGTTTPNSTTSSSAVGSAQAEPTVKTGDYKGTYHCGQASSESSDDKAVYTSFNIGCEGKGNPITDAAFAIIRFLSIGVGLIIVGSITFAGIQYTASRGDPKATSEAINRIRSNVVAFIIYIFSFAILNFLIPKGFFGQ